MALSPLGVAGRTEGSGAGRMDLGRGGGAEGVGAEGAGAAAGTGAGTGATGSSLKFWRQYMAAAPDTTATKTWVKAWAWVRLRTISTME